MRIATSVLLGSLLLAWAISVAAEVMYTIALPSGRSLEIAAADGSLRFTVTPYAGQGGYAAWSWSPIGLRTLLGEFQWGRSDWFAFQIACPFTVLLTAALPVAVGAQTRFRFPLSLWLAYTTLIAAQCAYYLR